MGADVVCVEGEMAATVAFGSRWPAGTVSASSVGTIVLLHDGMVRLVQRRRTGQGHTAC